MRDLLKQIGSCVDLHRDIPDLCFPTGLPLAQKLDRIVRRGFIHLCMMIGAKKNQVGVCIVHPNRCITPSGSGLPPNNVSHFPNYDVATLFQEWGQILVAAWR